MTVNEEVRRYLAAIGRKGGKERMKSVTPTDQAAFARARWGTLTAQERSRAARKAWKTRRAREKLPGAR